jgi:hypothetical protein
MKTGQSLNVVATGTGKSIFWNKNMNERIKQLADDATHYANGVCDADPNADWYTTRDQKFAELIVKECFDEIVKGVPLAGFARDRVLNHFGVEE